MTRIPEKNKKIRDAGRSAAAPCSIPFDVAGYGKTVTILGLILRDKMGWDTREEHIQSYISGVFGNGCIIKYGLLSMKRIATNLIVVGTTIIRQWMKELDETTLDYIVVTSRKTLESMDPSQHDVVLCSPVFYNPLLERFPSYAWKRFIYDEPPHTRISSMRQVIAGFIWFITATPDILLNQHRNPHNFLSNIFTQYMDYNLYKNLIVKNDDEYVRRSFSLPPLFEHHHVCFQPVFHAVKDLLSDSILEMISAGNVEGAVRVLGGNATSNLFELIEKDKRDAIQYVEYKIARFERTGDGEKMEKWVRRREKLICELEQLNERVNALVSVVPCPICLEKKTDPVLVCCCQNVFCGGCVLKWLRGHNTCPLCRRSITSDRLIYISSSSSVPDLHMRKEVVLPSKVDTILKILQEKTAEGGKIIIFSSFQETFELIRMTLNDNGFRFGEVRGSIAMREKILADFKDHDLDILFLNSIDSGAGLDLPEATDIILFHPMSESTLTQIRGRAYRIGRRVPLHIHYLR
jgi:hypothetical protein